MNESTLPSSQSPDVLAAFTAAGLTALLELIQVEGVVDSDLSDVLAQLPGGACYRQCGAKREVLGTMFLVLPKQVASQIASRYLPPGTMLSDALIDDVAGEFANVITGQAKTILKGTPYHFAMSMPQVSRSAAAPSLNFTEPSTVMISISSELGPLMLHVNLPCCPNS